MTPSEFLKRTMAIESEMDKAKKMSVDVGLISSKVGGQIYGGGISVLDIGTIHEYGLGNVPARSFLRTPFLMKKAEITDRIGAEWIKVMQGKSTAEKSLGLIGAMGTNVAKGAFTTQGYGTWQPIKPETAAAKGSGQTLIDTGTLRNSITWKVNT
jgi:phage gpG-like protein